MIDYSRHWPPTKFAHDFYRQLDLFRQSSRSRHCKQFGGSHTHIHPEPHITYKRHNWTYWLSKLHRISVCHSDCDCANAARQSPTTNIRGSIDPAWSPNDGYSFFRQLCRMIVELLTRFVREACPCSVQPHFGIGPLQVAYLIQHKLAVLSELDLDGTEAKPYYR